MSSLYFCMNALRSGSASISRHSLASSSLVSGVFAAFTAATVPLLLLRLIAPREPGRPGAAEIAAAVLLVLGSGFIVFNEGFANWQALWLAGTLLALAVTLGLARDAQGS